MRAGWCLVAHRDQSPRSRLRYWTTIRACLRQFLVLRPSFVGGPGAACEPFVRGIASYGRWEGRRARCGRATPPVSPPNSCGRSLIFPSWQGSRGLEELSRKIISSLLGCLQEGAAGAAFATPHPGCGERESGCARVDAHRGPSPDNERLPSPSRDPTHLERCQCVATGGEHTIHRQQIMFVDAVTNAYSLH